MKKGMFLLLGLMVSLGGRAQFNLQSSKLTERYFPDPAVEIKTPAFAKKSGFTTYDEMMAFLNALKEAYPSMEIRFIGESQKGRKIPMVVLKNGASSSTRVWLQGGLHGDEPGSTEAMLFLLDRLLNDAGLNTTWANLELGIVPMANIDGYEAQKRVSANGIDLNRDQVSLRAPESVALKRAFTEFRPAVALDFHEFRPFRKDFTRFGRDGIAAYYDAMFLYSGNLNVPEELRHLTQNTFVDSAKHSLARHQLTHHDYVTPQRYGGKVEFNLGSVHSRSSATSYALAGSVSTLLEIRGVGLGRTSFNRRIWTSYQIALSYLRTASANAAQLHQTLKKAAKSTQPITVTSERKVEKDSLTVIDLASDRAVRMPFTFHNALKSKPTLQRKRPTAYLLLPGQRKAILKLDILGLVADSLAADKEVEVEALQANALRFDTTGTEEDEADAPNPAAPTSSLKKTFPKGTYIVYLDQERANLACEVLEPENPNGFLANKVIRQKEGEEFPVYRYLKPDKIR